MSMVSELVARLAPVAGLTAGTTMFEDALPPSPNIVGCVRATGGSAPDPGFGVIGIQHEHPHVRVEFRGEPEDSAGPSAMAELAYRDVAKIQAATLGSTLYLFGRPLQKPFKIAIDDDKREVWGFNAAIDKAPS